MKKATIVVLYDDVNAHFLVIDRETGWELDRDEQWRYDDNFDEDVFISEIAARNNCEDYTIIHW